MGILTSHEVEVATFNMEGGVAIPISSKLEVAVPIFLGFGGGHPPLAPFLFFLSLSLSLSLCSP